MNTLNCPKCPGSFTRLELVGVEIDRCDNCHGIFLDRGELEALLDAEHRYSRGRGGDAPYTGRRRSDDTEGGAFEPDPNATQSFLATAANDADNDTQGDILDNFLDEIFS